MGTSVVVGHGTGTRAGSLRKAVQQLFPCRESVAARGARSLVQRMAVLDPPIRGG